MKVTSRSCRPIVKYWVISN